MSLTQSSTQVVSSSNTLWPTGEQSCAAIFQIWLLPKYNLPLFSNFMITRNPTLNPSKFFLRPSSSKNGLSHDTQLTFPDSCSWSRKIQNDSSKFSIIDAIKDNSVSSDFTTRQEFWFFCTICNFFWQDGWLAAKLRYMAKKNSSAYIEYQAQIDALYEFSPEIREILRENRARRQLSSIAKQLEK